MGRAGALVPNTADQDPFWLAWVKKIKEDSLFMTYYHHGLQISRKRLVWKAHNSKGTCGKFDVYFRFKTKEQLFTKGKTILKQALKKIAQACLTFVAFMRKNSLKYKLSLKFKPDVGMVGKLVQLAGILNGARM
jgi:hypothetical protein